LRFFERAALADIRLAARRAGVSPALFLSGYVETF
jgi:hypothetical protein